MFEILLVEDDNKIRELFSRFLATKGYRVHEAKDGQEAITVAARQHFDLVLMDVKMPKLDGLSACQCIRASSPTTKVVLITGYHITEEMERLTKHGDVECLRKPFTFNDLSALLDRMASGGTTIGG